MKKTRRLLAALLSLVLLAGCKQSPEIYRKTYLDLFDTVTTISGSGMGQEVFVSQADALHDALLEYHRLLDVYNSYEGMNNLKTVNDQAGIAPVAVDGRIIDFLLFARQMYTATGGRVDVTMGSVLKLWHEARTAALENPEQSYLPHEEALQDAGTHTGFRKLVIDRENGTVFITDPLLRLDVGAMAKGWALEQVCKDAPPGILLDLGGNIGITGPKANGDPWVIGIQDPNSHGYLQTLEQSQGAVVTSGDYQRYYTVEGQRYHHIIDPETLYPAGYWQSVTIFCEDSGVADALSTALFLMDRQEGQALLDQYNARAWWVDREGNLMASP